MVAPPVYLFVEDLERDVVALIVEERYPVREPEELPARLEHLAPVHEPDLDEEGEPRVRRGGPQHHGGELRLQFLDYAGREYLLSHRRQAGGIRREELRVAL